MSSRVECVVSYLTGAGVVMKGGYVRVNPWSSEDKSGGGTRSWFAWALNPRWLMTELRYPPGLVPIGDSCPS
jgi:hypothetical protein